MRFPSLLKGVNGVVLDTMVMIYLLEDHPVYADPCEELFKWAATGRFSGIITPISMAELVVKPLEAGRNDIADRYRTALCNLPNIRLCDCSWKTGTLAGALRAKYGMALPDMFQVACAMEYGKVLITNDKALKKVSEIDVILLNEI